MQRKVLLGWNASGGGDVLRQTLAVGRLQATAARCSAATVLNVKQRKLERVTL